MSFVLSAHAWLIAVIFVPYILVMTGFGIYIWHTGRPCSRDDDPQDPPGPPLPAAA